MAYADIGKSLGQEAETLVRCISIRAAYGGMGGDVAMLKALASVWAARCAALIIVKCIKCF